MRQRSAPGGCRSNTSSKEARQRQQERSRLQASYDNVVTLGSGRPWQRKTTAGQAGAATTITGAAAAAEAGLVAVGGVTVMVEKAAAPAGAPKAAGKKRCVAVAGQAPGHKGDGAADF